MDDPREETRRRRVRTGGEEALADEVLASPSGADGAGGADGGGGAGRASGVPGALGLELPTRFRRGDPGARPGIDHQELATLPSRPGETWITCIDYGPEQIVQREVTDLGAFLAAHRPPWCTVRWINVDGLSDMGVIHGLATKYALHPLAIEDLLQTTHRPKVEVDDGAPDKPRMFVIARMLQLVENQLHSEQISIFLGQRTILTFQETHGDVWDPIRARLRVRNSRLRTGDASYLLYGLIDALVDHCFPIVEWYGDRLEGLEERVLEDGAVGALHEIHAIKRELLLLRRALWPMRDVVQALQHDASGLVNPETRTWLRDVQDHALHVVDILETYRELCTELTETYRSTVSLELNQTIRVLTVLATIFTPITFLASVYGMNFQVLPELGLPWGYAAFWGVSLAIAGTMFLWFRRRHWL